MRNFSYDQKAVLCRTIRSFIRTNHIHSLLDIGAGDGLLALCLIKAVSNYVAVEKNKQYTRELRKGGIIVIKGAFPIEIEGTFDIVLISHSVPERGELYRNFFKKAWQKVKKKGILVVITFKGTNGGFSELYKRVFGENNKKDQQLYRRIRAQLNRLGKIQTKKVTSILKSKDIEVMIKIFSFLSSNKAFGKIFKEEKLRQVLKKHYKIPGGYAVPSNHLILSIKKRDFRKS